MKQALDAGINFYDTGQSIRSSSLTQHSTVQHMVTAITTVSAIHSHHASLLCVGW